MIALLGYKMSCSIPESAAFAPFLCASGYCSLLGLNSYFHGVSCSALLRVAPWESSGELTLCFILGLGKAPCWNLSSGTARRVTEEQEE